MADTGDALAAEKKRADDAERKFERLHESVTKLIDAVAATLDVFERPTSAEERMAAMLRLARANRETYQIWQSW